MKFHRCRHSTWPYNVCWMNMWEPLKTAIDCSASTGWLKGFRDPCDHAWSSFIGMNWLISGRSFEMGGILFHWRLRNMKGQWPCSPMLRYLIRCTDIAVGSSSLRPKHHRVKCQPSSNNLHKGMLLKRLCYNRPWPLDKDKRIKSFLISSLFNLRTRPSADQLDGMKAKRSLVQIRWEDVALIMQGLGKLLWSNFHQEPIYSWLVNAPCHSSLKQVFQLHWAGSILSLWWTES
jgi:hypothetical protein